MRVQESADFVTLKDQRVAVCGDWHGNVGWARTIARVLPYLAPDVSTMLHLGDWQMPPAEIDEVFTETNINRIYVTLGNHERWHEITPLLEAHPGCAVRVSEITRLLPTTSPLVHQRTHCVVARGRRVRRPTISGTLLCVLANVGGAF